MKKFIIVVIAEILLLFNLCVCLYSDIVYIKAFIKWGYYSNAFAILNFVGTFTVLAAIIIIALVNISLFKPFFDKLSSRNQARKELRTQAKAEKAEADKQNKIKALEEELDELKNN